jgi:hypothetical protein
VRGTIPQLAASKYPPAMGRSQPLQSPNIGQAITRFDCWSISEMAILQQLTFRPVVFAIAARHDVTSITDGTHSFVSD